MALSPFAAARNIRDGMCVIRIAVSASSFRNSSMTSQLPRSTAS